jgi:hypothetical protein
MVLHIFVDIAEDSLVVSNPELTPSRGEPDLSESEFGKAACANSASLHLDAGFEVCPFARGLRLGEIQNVSEGAVAVQTSQRIRTPRRS